MKTISIRQPWASLIIHGHKKIETRSWNTKYRGELLIHAGLAKDKVSIELYNSWESSHLYDSIFRGVAFNNLPFGAIIGKVELVNVVNSEKIKPVNFLDNDYLIKSVEEYPLSMKDEACIVSEKELAFGDYSPNRYGWLLANPVIFDKPIPCKGQLGLWNFEIFLK